jgi:hypothetical protein
MQKKGEYYPMKRSIHQKAGAAASACKRPEGAIQLKDTPANHHLLQGTLRPLVRFARSFPAS